MKIDFNFHPESINTAISNSFTKDPKTGEIIYHEGQYCEKLGKKGMGSLLCKIRNGAARMYYQYRDAKGKPKSLALGEYKSRSNKACFKTITEAKDAAREAYFDHQMAIKEGYLGVKEYRHAKITIAREKRDAEIQAEIEAKKALEADQKYSLRALLELYITIKLEQGARDVRKAHNLFTKWVYSTDYASMAAHSIQPVDINLIVDAPLVEGKQSVFRQLRAYLKAAFNLALDAKDTMGADARLKPFNITKVPVTIPKDKGLLETNARERNLDSTEVSHLLRKLNDSYQADVVRLLLLTGQRIRQLLEVPLIDLNLNDKTLTLTDRKGRRSQPKRHQIYLAHEAFRIVKTFADYSNKIGSPYLFSRSPDGSLSQDMIRRYVKQLSSEMLKEGLIRENFQTRDLRRTVQSRMADQTRIPLEIQNRILSHGVYGLVEKHYMFAHYRPQFEEAMDIWEKWLFNVERGIFKDRKVVHANFR